jgi:cell division protein ZapA
MKNKISVTVAGHEFTIVSLEGEEYVRGVAAEVDGDIQSVMNGNHLSLSDAAVLTALNFADRSKKSVDTADHLRLQVKTYLDETQKLKAELAETRRELSRLKSRNAPPATPAPPVATGSGSSSAPTTAPVPPVATGTGSGGTPAAATPVPPVATGTGSGGTPAGK